MELSPRDYEAMYKELIYKKKNSELFLWIT